MTFYPERRRRAVMPQVRQNRSDFKGRGKKNKNAVIPSPPRRTRDPSWFKYQKKEGLRVPSLLGMTAFLTFSATSVTAAVIFISPATGSSARHPRPHSQPIFCYPLRLSVLVISDELTN